jgi:hypothetical protein
MGKTVFAGAIDNDLEFIKSCKCDLFVDGIKRATIDIEGEMITENRSKTDKRSLTTTDNVVLDEEEKKHCEIVFLGARRLG